MSTEHEQQWHECTSHQGTCPTPLELLRWQRDQARVEAERLSELGQEWQARARVAEAEVERLRGVVARVEALAEEWGTEGPSLVRHAHDGGDVHEGLTLERCANELRALIDESADA